MKIAGRLENAVAAAAVRLPDAALLALMGGRRTVRDGLKLDLPTQTLLRLIEAAGCPAPNEIPVEQGRRLFVSRAGAVGARPRPMEKIVDRTIPGPASEIPVRIYVPMQSPSGEPLLVYYHGGGWVLGDIETHDGACRLLASEARCIVVSVDYRLAPEHRFPAAVDDAFAAFCWVVEHAADIGADPSRVAVGGDGAGGCLAAVTARLARDQGVSRPCFQLLIYPVTDLRHESRSYELFAEGFLLTRVLMRWFRRHYLESDAQAEDPRASPLLAEDLSGLGPALVMTAGFDPLRDEGRAYARRLRDAGNAAVHRGYDGLIHGFFSMSGVIPAARSAAADAAAALRRAYDRYR